MTVWWFDEVPAGYSVLGRVVIVIVPYLESMMVKSSGFMEDDDEFSF